jgi:hypothetical protein
VNKRIQRLSLALALLAALAISACGPAGTGGDNTAPQTAEPTPPATDEAPSGTEEAAPTAEGVGEVIPGEVDDYASLVNALSAAGLTIEPGDQITQDFFSVPGQVIRVNGEDVQVFEYADEAAAGQEAATISPDGGSVGTTMVTWVATPHFYQSGRLIVLYLGDNAEILGALEAALGTQIAGG